ncbi:hypothetical protein KBI52_10845 [Microvirga sp. HBU67558]|uniref:hypothetical protein n=1 Tax=Microvirga sp. HBU67558 TaxID=2824562 RepID=UPI001B3826F5|nr:hypothetical protein [Microvirga sp. HBU67558]MBQ0820702.1 hypothetical protein [Microvirga sp. HBU67558]
MTQAAQGKHVPLNLEDVVLTRLYVLEKLIIHTNRHIQLEAAAREGLTLDGIRGRFVTMHGEMLDKFAKAGPAALETGRPFVDATIQVLFEDLKKPMAELAKQQADSMD